MGIDSSNARRAVFLDRDGVINRAVVRDGKPYAPASVDELELLAGVAQAVDRLHEAGYVLVVVTNQPDVARGKQSRASVEAINARIRDLLPSIDDVRVCYHDDPDQCACRKPLPGMLVDAADAHRIDLSASVMVGDRWRDIEAGRRAGCATVLVDYGYNEPKSATADAVVGSLAEAAEWILARG